MSGVAVIPLITYLVSLQHVVLISINETLIINGCFALTKCLKLTKHSVLPKLKSEQLIGNRD